MSDSPITTVGMSGTRAGPVHVCERTQPVCIWGPAWATELEPQYDVHTHTHGRTHARTRNTTTVIAQSALLAATSNRAPETQINPSALAARPYVSLLSTLVPGQIYVFPAT